MSSIRTEIDKAIRLGKDIEIEYVKYDGTRSKRRVSNISFCNEYGAYGYENDHISGYCHLREEKRHFKIDRIQSIRVLPDGLLVKKDSNSEAKNMSYNSSGQVGAYSSTIRPSYTSTTTSNYTPTISSSSSSNKKSSEGCYIATMVYGDYDHPKVMVLRQYRDNYLMNSFIGRCFIKIYYYLSPKAVGVLRDKKHINNLIRAILNRLVNKIER